MSIINNKHKHIFIHNPKTAGHSMEVLPWVGGRGHDTAFDYKHDLNAFDDYFSWGFVREPIDRFLSAYASYVDKNHFDSFLSRDYKVGEWIDYLVHHLKKPNVLSNDQKGRMAIYPDVESDYPFPFVQFIPQHYFLCVKQKIAVDFVGRFERLQQDFSVVAKQIGKQNTIPHINWSRNKPKLTKSMGRKLQRIYAVDFEIFGY